MFEETFYRKTHTLNAIVAVLRKAKYIKQFELMQY